MGLRNNFDYWLESLKNPEPVFDDYYMFEEIIVSDAELIKKIERLRELIISYCVVIEKNENASSEILDEIYGIIISVDKIQYTEFLAFWKCLDMTYSIFEDLSNNKDVLKVILQKYCERRRKLYDRLGYSNTTVQALYDNGSSRKKGNAGIRKITDMCNTYFKNFNHSTTMDQFNKYKICYILPDKGDKKLFDQFLNEYNLDFEYGRGMQNKKPDFLLRYSDQFFIIEAKHLKEGGGEQNKSVGELIGFVRQAENINNIHYIGFMDGVYFNLFISPRESEQKEDVIKRQLTDIRNTIKENENNFIVNTKGFELLLGDLKTI